MSLAPRLAGLVLLGTAILFGQAPPTNASLSGKYFVRHVQFMTDANNNVLSAGSILGAIAFDGVSSYSFTGQRVLGTGAASSYTASGTYSVNPDATVALTNPQNSSLAVNARLGAEALIGSSTEAGANSFDLFVAIPAPSTTQTNASIGATFNAVDFELTNASTAQVRDAFLTMTLDGAGHIGTFAIQGHAANVSAGANVSQTLTGGTYSVSSDGSVTITFPQSTLLSTTARTLQTSQSGNVILGGTPGSHDIFFAMKSSSDVVSLSGRSWLAGIRVDSSGSTASYTGSSTVIAVDGQVIQTKRLHESIDASPLNLTASSPYATAADGTGSIGPFTTSLGGAFNIAGANVGTALDPGGYEIFVGEAIPNIAGSGGFIIPGGVVNAASNAPSGDAISPGEFIAIYGTGLAAGNASALPPYPTEVGNVSVNINGISAAVQFVSTGQINCLVPYEVTGPTALIVVTNNNSKSNTVQVPLALTSPGVFTQDGTGVNDGAIVHGDNQSLLVNASSPAKKGETVVMYLTGLGALTTPVSDGYGATSIDNATTALQVYVAGVPVPASDVLYMGLSSLPGLYQINFTVPTALTVSGELPVAIATPQAFHDEVNIAVQ